MASLNRPTKESPTREDCCLGLQGLGFGGRGPENRTLTPDTRRRSPFSTGC